jgi:hypothetical protein
LVDDYGHHKKKIEAKGPKRSEFKTFETAARDGLFFCLHELIALERREYERSVREINLFLL